MPREYIGLMSGTSLDGIDAVHVAIDGASIAHLAARTAPIPPEIRQQILELIASAHAANLDRLGMLDTQIGELFARTALELLAATGKTPDMIHAIGSHGQTLWHRPDLTHPFTLQIGDPNRIAEITGITTVADFRRRDMAAGGQGAPLVPAFHRTCLHSTNEDRVVLNLGGMANISLLPGDTESDTLGYDTGPGNVLLDLHAHRHLGQPYDRDGQWGASGSVDPNLLAHMLADPYFAAPPPKSTGREYFNEAWLEKHLDSHAELAPADIQATLTELTARSVVDAVRAHGARCDRMLVCGGGVHNRRLMERLSALLAPSVVESTEACGIAPDWVEATAFAWLAERTLSGLPGNLPSVTGARHPVILGAIYPGTKSPA